MKKYLLLQLFTLILSTYIVNAQELKEKDVPELITTALIKKFPDAKKVNWEKEKGNFEANWGGKSGEDNSAIFSPSGNFIEIVQAISVDLLPVEIVPYITKNYKGAKIKEAGKVTDASGRHMFEIEIKGKDLIFDEKGVFLKED